MSAVNDASANSPVAYLIFPDPAWEGASEVVSATSSNGVVAGVVEASSSNRGYAHPYQEGDPSGTAELTLRAQGGGAGASGGWLYRLDSETTDANWKGMNALTVLQRSKPVTVADPLYAQALVYSNVYQRLVVSYVYSTTQVKIAYASAGNTLGSWSTTTLSVSDADFSTMPFAGLATCELADGNLLMALQVLRYGSRDVDLYESTNGGTSWSRSLIGLGEHDTARDLAAATYEAVNGLKMASSGDYVRLLAEDNQSDANPVTIYGYVSKDRGASWKGNANTITADAWPSGSNKYPGSAPYDIVGLGDIAGTFLLAYLSTDVVVPESINIAVASGEDEFAVSASLQIVLSDTATYGSGSFGTTPHIKALWWCSIPDYLLLYAWVESTAATTYSDIVLFKAAKSDPLNPANWTYLGRVTGFSGAMFYGPHRPNAVWAGSRGFVSAGMQDPTLGAGLDPVVNGHWTMEFGAWDPKPLAPTMGSAGIAYYFNRENRLPAYQWAGCFGLPDLDALTPYTHGTFSTVSTTWNRDSVTVTTTSTTGFNRYVLSLTPATNAECWGYANNRGYVFRYRIKVTDERDNTVEDLGFRIMAPTTQAVLTTGYDITVRTFGASIVVYNNIAGSALATLTTTDAASELEIEAIIAGNQLWIARRLVSSAPLGAWTESGPYTMTSGAITGQLMRVGVIAATGSGTNSTMIIYEWLISRANDLGQRGDVTKPTDLVGTPMFVEPTLVAGGMSVGWSGLGSRDGDTWTAALVYQRGVVNFSLPSPRHYWESTSLAEQAIVFQSDPDGGAAPRFQMNGIALFGTVDLGVTVQFNDTDSWGTPSVSWSLSAALWTSLDVAAVSGSSVQVTAVSGTFKPWPGQLVGHFIRFTSGSASGKTYRILGDQNSIAGWVTVEGGVNLATAGVVAGDDVTIFTDRMVYLDDTFRKYRYMRIVLPDVSSVASSLGTATGSHRIGAIVPGYYCKLDRNTGVLVQGFSDDEENVYSEAVSRSGVRHRNQEGPSGRTIGMELSGANPDADPSGPKNEVRRAIRDALREGCDGSTQPVALVLDSNWRGRDTVLYGTLGLAGGTKLDEVVALPGPDSRHHWSGDLKLLFVEDV